MDTLRIPANVIIEGSLKAQGDLPDFTRDDIVQESFQSYPIAPESLRIWDAFATPLPGTSAADDLGVYAIAFATGLPYVGTGDVKTLSVTRYARALVQLPPEYVAGQSVRIRIAGGMLTTVASTSATVDVEAYKTNRDTTKTGADLCATAAQSINSLTFAERDFDLTATSLAPGDWIDVRFTIATVDAATATAVIAALAAIDLQLDIKG